MSKKLNIRPTSGVYATYKRLSYQPWTAIAEFVDNSTQSFYDHRTELMNLKYYNCLQVDINYISDAQNGDRLEITDNAFGMEWYDFQRAIVLDKPPQSTNGRNEFGMGLKTAACWFGSLWSVETTQLGSRNKYYAEVDIDQLGKYKTEELDVQEELVSPKDHYTIITIKRLNKKISGPRTISKVKELLGSIYREDLRSGLVRITYNGTVLQFKEPPVFVETINGQTKTWKKDVSFTVVHEGDELNVKGFIAIRIPGSVKDAGLTLIRRGRVIVGGSESNYRPYEIFGESNKYTWQRLYGELHMDNWPVTQAKDSFDWHNSGLEEAFIEQLLPITKEYRRKAENLRIREVISSTDLAKDALDGFSNSGAFENGKIEVVNNSEVNTQNKISETQTISGNSQIEAINGPEGSTTEKDTPTEQVSSSDSVTIEGGNQVDFSFKYKGDDYLFHIVFDMDNPTLHWLLVEMKSETEYILSINMRHSFFKPLVEKREFLPIMTRMSVALVLAEIETTKTSTDGKVYPCDIRLRMNEILEQVRKGEK